MNGTLIYDLRVTPKIGDNVIIVVNRKNFPSGVWNGVLSDVNPRVISEDIERYGGFYNVNCPCVAKMYNNFVVPCDEWVGKEPEGPYFVYFSTAGVNALMQQLHDQKAEVKKLKQRLEENEQTARDVFKGLFKLAGLDKLDVTRQSSGLGAIYAPSVKK